MGLKELYLALEKNNRVRYTQSRNIETLEIMRGFSNIEKLIIVNKNLINKLIYTGEDATSMFKTLEMMRLPNFYPTNYGERIFYLFKQELEDKQGPITLEIDVQSGFEMRYKSVLQKLLGIYASEN